MTNEQIKHLKSLASKPARAAYLLTIGVSAVTTIENLNVVCRATVGEVRLPVTGDSEADAIAKGVEWLQEQAAQSA